jgi:hypothetical protein
MKRRAICALWRLHNHSLTPQTDSVRQNSLPSALHAGHRGYENIQVKSSGCELSANNAEWISPLFVNPAASGGAN